MYRNRYCCRILKKQFLKNTRIPNCITIRSVGALLFHTEGPTDKRVGGQPDRETDRQTDIDTWTGMTKLVVAFHNFANVPKMVWH